jgi:7-cyano-7-deazaguanine synthase
MIVCIVSGGMDSVTLAHMLAQEDKVLLASFDYGQRHRCELQYAERCAERLHVDHQLIKLPIRDLLTGSALTDDSVEVPHGHYEAKSMEATVVPNRNAVMLAIATALAVSTGAKAVATAVHAGDHAIYPDCRPAFIDAMTTMERIACEGFIDPEFVIEAPFIRKSKADICRIGASLGVPWEETWSCYEGGEVQCGLCGTCTERREAFEIAEIADPTSYKAA